MPTVLYEVVLLRNSGNISTPDQNNIYFLCEWQKALFSSEGRLSADISLNQYHFEGVTKLIYPFSDLYVWIDS